MKPIASPTFHDVPQAPITVTKRPNCPSLSSSPSTATPKMNNIKTHSAADFVRGRVTLSEGLTCVDFHPGHNLLAVGCTKAVHILEVRLLTHGSCYSTPTAGGSGCRGGQSDTHLTPQSTGHMGLRQCGMFSNISKVEAAVWYPQPNEDVLAFVQRSRNITILFDALTIKAGKRMAKQWIHNAVGRCLVSPIEAGGGLLSTAVMNVSNMSCTPVSGSAPIDLMHSAPFARRDKVGRSMVEVIIPTGHIHVERIVWDPHNAYTLALTSDATHFELWRIPVRDNCVQPPCLILRPPAHDERSTTRDISFSLTNPHLIVVAVEMANTGKVVVYDRRCIEVSRCVATVGPCFVVSFHPTYSDLLAVCYRKTKTKTNSRVQFFQLVGSSVSVGTPQSSAGVSDNNYGSCELFLGGVNAATPIAEQNLISPIDTVDPLNRLRWRPAVVPVASEAATVDSHDAIVDKISSQLWFATTSLSGQEVSVWDGSNVYCPIFSIKSVCEGRSATRRERTLREPTDCVWVNAVTLVTVFKDGEVGLTSLLDEPTESKETLFRCGTDSALEKASTCGSCALMAGFSGMFSLAAILPTSAVLPDFFGHCLLVRNTSSALREHYTNIIQSDKTKVLDQLLVENSGEDDGVTAASVTTLSTPAWSSIAASPVPAAGTAAPVRVARESVRATPTGLTPAEVGRPHSPKVPLRQSQARASQSSSVVAVSCVAGSTAVSSAPLTSKCPELLFPLLMSFTSHSHVAGIPSEQPPLTEGTTLKNGESMGAWHTQERQHEDPNKIPPHSSISFSVRRGNISSSDSGCDASHEAGTAENTRVGYRQLSGTARSGTRKGQFSLLVPPTFGVVPGEASEKLLPMALQPHHAGTVSPFSLMGSGSDSSTFVQSNTLPATCSHVNSDWGSSPLTDIQSARRAVQGLVDPSINSRSTGAPPAPVEATPPTTLPTSSSARLPPLGNKSFVNPIIERLNISASVPGTAYVEHSYECGAFVRYAMDWDVGYDVACQMRSRRSAAATSEEYADIDGEDEEMELANARRADKCFTKIMAHNAKVCFAHASRTSGQTDAQCGKEPAPGGRGIEGDSDRTRLDTTTNSPFDIRGRLWASAREMWRNRDTLNTASHVATLLDYGSQVGDVQFCAVLYLLFCLWWKQRHRNLRRHPCPLLLSYDTAAMEEHCATTRAGAPQISGCTPQRWRLRALQWVEQYVSRLYVMRLYVPINELQLVVPEVLGDSNPVLPRTEEIAQKLFTCVYCGSCRKRELVPHHTTRKRQVSQGCSSVEQLPQGKRSEHSSDMCMSTCSSSEDSESLSSCCLSFGSPCVLGGDGVNTCGTNSGAAAVCDWSGANEVLHNNNNNGGSGIVTTETCGAVTSRNAVCRSCGSQSLMTCVICEEVVEGMFMWLRCCGHGGHVQHIQEWLSVANECPACGVPVTMKE